MNQLMILFIIFLTESSMAKHKVRLIMFSTQPLAAKSSCIPGKLVGGEIVALNLAFKPTGGEIITHTRGQSIYGKIVTQTLFVNPSRFHDIIVQVVTQSTLFSTYVKWHYVQQYTRQVLYMSLENVIPLSKFITWVIVYGSMHNHMKITCTMVANLS